MVDLLGMLAPLPTHRRNLIAMHQHSHDRDDRRRRKMPAETERCATAEGAEDGWMSPLLFDGCVRLFRKELVGVEDRGAGTPDRGVIVDHVAGHVNDAVLFEEVAVLEEGVLQHDAYGGVVAPGAKYFLEGGVEERADGSEFPNV